jgi:hypothetical protein
MYFTSTMPIIDADKLATMLEGEDLAIALDTLVSRGKQKGRLRASAPKQPYKVEGSEAKDRAGLVYYAWRLAAFQVSPRGEHHCLPFVADFYLDAGSEGYHPERVKIARERAQRIADAIAACVPLADHHGTRRWAHAMYGV